MVATAAGALDILEKEGKCNHSSLEKKRADCSLWTLPSPHKPINSTRSLLYALYDLIELCSRNLMIKLNVICFVTMISVAENHTHTKATRNTHHIVNTIVTFHGPVKSMLEEQTSY